jgi:hypothetical protein
MAQAQTTTSKIDEIRQRGTLRMAGILTGHRYHEIGRVRDTIASTFA